MPAIAGHVSNEGNSFIGEDGQTVKLYSTAMHAGQEPRAVDLGRYAGKDIAAVYQQSSGDGSDLYGVRRIGILEDIDIFG
jgi:hypothetical protein